MVMLHVIDIQSVYVINYRDDWLGHFRQSRKHFIFKKGSSLDNPSSPHGTPNCHFLGMHRKFLQDMRIFCFPDPRVLFADAAVEVEESLIAKDDFVVECIFNLQLFQDLNGKVYALYMIK